MTPQIKTCFKCNISKPLDEFYKHPAMADGHLNKCKECTKAENRENRNKRLYHYREYDRKRYVTNEDRRQVLLNYSKTDAYKKSHAKANARFKKNYPQKINAHARVRSAILAGKLTKCPCEICGNNIVQAHHEDYSKPLEVIWLCSKHHAWIHQ